MLLIIIIGIFIVKKVAGCMVRAVVIVMLLAILSFLYFKYFR